MISPQIWAYIGWVLFSLFVFAIVALAYALYRDAQLNKNKKTSLPSLDIIEATEKKTFFANDGSTPTNALTDNTNKIPSRRALRSAKTGATPPLSPSPAVSAKPSAFFDDDEEFHLTAGQD